MKIERSLYRRGIRFQCQGSGNCCRFRDGYSHVYVSLPERRLLAKHLGMSTRSFTWRYCEREGDELQLVSSGDGCIFLDGSRCTVYEARPRQCRSWPFWPENMNLRAWQSEVVALCPGVGKGEVQSAETIEKHMENT